MDNLELGSYQIPHANWPIFGQVKSQEEAASSFNRAIFGTVQRGSPGYKALEAPLGEPRCSLRDDSFKWLAKM